MFCTNCGKDNQENAAHCTECGASMNSAPAQSAPAQSAPVATTPVSATATESPMKKFMTPKFIGIAAGILVVIIVGICVLAYNIGRVNMKDFMISKEDFIDDEIVTGINGRGVANADDFFDFKEFNELIDFDLDDLGDMADFAGLFSSMEDFDYPVEVKINKDKELKNGDVIEVTLKIDKESLEKDFDVKTYGKEKMTFKYTVSGLQEATILDPFQFIDITFKGINSDYYVDIDVNKEKSKKIKNLEFKCDGYKVTVYNKDLDVVTKLYYEDIESEGKIKVKCTYNEEDLAKELFLIDETVKEYDVPDLGDYATKASDISIDDIKVLKAEADKKLKDKVYTDEEGKFKFNKIYFNVAQDGSDLSYDHNKLYITYYYDRVTEYEYIEDDVDCCIIAFMIEDIVVKDGKIVGLDDIYISYGRNNSDYDIIDDYNDDFISNEKRTCEVISVE